MYSCTSKAHVKLRTVTATRPQAENHKDGEMFYPLHSFPSCTVLQAHGRHDGLDQA
jgi:hypothetical protein